jgi:hypothetical protein
VAGALNLKGPQALYGRNWGCLEDYRFLHFELCYYRAIDYAIAHKLPRVEGGAQGEHKIQRGYLPVETYSATGSPIQRLKAAISDFLDRERAYIAQEKAALDEMSPYTPARNLCRDRVGDVQRQSAARRCRALFIDRDRRWAPRPRATSAPGRCSHGPRGGGYGCPAWLG